MYRAEKQMSIICEKKLAFCHGWCYDAYKLLLEAKIMDIMNVAAQFSFYYYYFFQ